MPNANCICPDFVSGHISDPLIFQTVFIGSLLLSDDQIILDAEGRLEEAYTQSVSDNTAAFELLKVWKSILAVKSDGKILKTTSIINADNNVYDLVFDVTKKAISTFNKIIISYDNNTYKDYLDEMLTRRISLYNLQNISSGNCIETVLMKKFSFDSLISDLSYVLHLLGRTNNKGNTEDHFNDHVRNMLKCKEYEVLDQTREGTSLSGISAGELDLVIENNGFLACIIEAMKLTSLDVKYINNHYEKLLKQYNPLQISNTALITYYMGKDFDSWWDRYVKHIEEIEIKDIGLPKESLVINTKKEKTPYGRLKQLIQYLDISGNRVCCVHFAVAL